MSRRTPLIVGLAALGMALLVFFLLVFPKMRQVGEAQEQLEAARGDEMTLQAELARLQSVREDAPRIRRQLARFRREVPPVADLPGLINKLQNAADTAGVDFFAVSPQAPAVSSAGAAAELPAQIQVIGGFFPVDEFLFRLENLPRAAKVTNVALTEGPDGLPQIQVNLSVMFFTSDTEAGPGTAAPEAPEVAAAPEAVPGSETTEESGVVPAPPAE